jgi:hypothetical protein
MHMDENYAVWKRLLVIAIGVIVVGGTVSVLYLWYQISRIEPLAGDLSGQATTTPVGGLKAIQKAQLQAQQQAQAGSSTPATSQELHAIQKVQQQAQQKNEASSGGSSGTTAEQDAQLKAIQEAQLKAAQQAGIN